ncbi:MAG: SpoIIE family protein phosphatase [Limisphaerales bacterium]
MSSRVQLRALILEDSEFDARVMVQALRAGGYEVQSRRVETGDAMEEALTAQPWDIVLADYNMPAFNAPQALRILQAAGLDIPFIIVSGGIGEDVAVAAMKAGAHDYVMKGSPARLLPAVDRELREAEMRRKRREAEGKLRESELRYRSLWETSPDAVLLCDEAGEIGFANPAAETVFGLAGDSFAGRPIASLEPGPGGGLSRALAQASGTSGDAPRSLVEGPGLRSDGREILLEVASSRFEIMDRNWFVLFARDITEKRRNETELRAREEQMRAAREIQQRLFPKQSPTVPGYDLAGMSVPADATGGDYYDFLPMTDGMVGLVVADVSGHGLGPCLLMMETRAQLRVVARNRIDPGEILARANRVIAEDTEGQNYVTALLVRLDPARNELVHASAGHPAALVIGADGTVKERLKRTGGPLGFVQRTPAASAAPVRLERGDVLLLYTDGIKEARPGAPGANPDDEFGTDRMIEVVRANLGRTARELIQLLVDAARSYSAPAPLEDDLTLLVVKVL